ncbi:MAG TPA: hypothetical protein VE623_17860 [Acidimicrobiales bacterium]|jgi:hypothetical protein|nr:hypothetical protein [Acidimicrobiales bacterium]
MAEVSGPSPGWVVPVARYAAVVLGGVTALVLAANPATRWFARLRRQDDPDYPDDVPLLFDVNTEATVPTWYSAGLLLAVAAVCVVLAVVARDADGGGARRWVVLGLVFVGMSLDETVALHERLDSGVTDTLDVEGTGALRHPWVVAGVVLAAGLAVVTARAIVTLPRHRRRWVALGLGIYVGGALGLEAVSGVVLDAAGEGLAYAAVTWAEEGAEMVGALVTCCALLAALDVRLHDGAIRVALADTRPRASVAPPHA